MSAPWFGVDLGGTKLLGVALDPATATIIATSRADTPLGGPEILGAIETVVDDLRTTAGVPAAVGIGAAGLVDQQGILRFGPNLPGVIDLDIIGELTPRLGTAVRVDNDATCGAIAELHLGAARGVSTALVVALGTGIGGALIMDGEIRRGSHHMAGEFGHLLVDPSGVRCGCGQRGCWEQYASGNALGRFGRESAAAGRAPALLDMVDGRVESIGGELVAAAAAAGDPVALGILDEFARWVALGLAGLVNICDPELVVMGGGLVANGDLVLDPIRRHLDGLVVGAGSRPPVEVVGATAGPAAAAVGAALLASPTRPHATVL